MSDLATSEDSTFVASATLDVLLRMDRGTAFKLLKAQLERFRAIGSMQAIETMQAAMSAPERKHS